MQVKVSLAARVSAAIVVTLGAATAHAQQVQGSLPMEPAHES